MEINDEWTACSAQPFYPGKVKSGGLRVTKGSISIQAENVSLIDGEPLLPATTCPSGWSKETHQWQTGCTASISWWSFVIAAHLSILKPNIHPGTWTLWSQNFYSFSIQCFASAIFQHHRFIPLLSAIPCPFTSSIAFLPSPPTWPSLRQEIDGPLGSQS